MQLTWIQAQGQGLYQPSLACNLISFWRIFSLQPLPWHTDACRYNMTAPCLTNTLNLLLWALDFLHYFQMGCLWESAQPCDTCRRQLSFRAQPSEIGDENCSSLSQVNNSEVPIHGSSEDPRRSQVEFCSSSLRFVHWGSQFNDAILN